MNPYDGATVYQVDALRTASERDSVRGMLANAALGLAGESSELLENVERAALVGLATKCGKVAEDVKKIIFQGHPIDGENVVEELGDVCWYLALACQAVGASLGVVMERNIEKLRRRYPTGEFRVEDSLNRAKHGDG